MRRVWQAASVALLFAPLLSGCIAIAAGATVVAVSAARQERTIGNAVDDMRIKTALSSKLVEESADNFVNVSSTVVEGRVLLTGRVSTPEARLDASRVAWSIEGVRKVDNDIQVTEDGQWLDRPNDIYIRTKLAADLLTDPDVKDVNYTIDVVNGVVYLMGVAQDQAEIDRVIADAHDIPQVKRVENYVVLKTDPIRYGFAANEHHVNAEPVDEEAPRAVPVSSAPVEVSDEPPPPEAEPATAPEPPMDATVRQGEATHAPTPLAH